MVVKVDKREREIRNLVVSCIDFVRALSTVKLGLGTIACQRTKPEPDSEGALHLPPGPRLKCRRLVLYPRKSFAP